jgi:membrane fusion protein (multidrug efflux system)
MPDDAGFRLAEAVRPRLARVTKTRWLAIGAGFAGAVLLLVLGVNWLTVGRYQVSTDNAYVRADISRVSARVEGFVRALPVADNQLVHAGDVLLEIDDADARAAVAAAEASLSQARGELASMQAARALAQADLARYRNLANRNFLSPARLQQLEIQARQASAGVVAANAAVAAAAANVEQARLDLERTIVRAPIDGAVGDRLVQVGQLVQPGTPLLSVVPLQAVYVVANFKETQIEDFRPDQPVIIRPDIAHGLRLRGVVESLAPASGSEFSIIPTDTATGNFTKIVQRVPVRIRLEPGQEGLELLRPGLSAHVTVDTRR